MKTITIYVRPGCHLCDEAEAAIADLAAGQSWKLELINIEHDDELHRRFLELIPVVEVDGVVRLKLDEFRGADLAKALV